MWSEKQSLELISLYEKKPVIWNPRNPYHYKQPFKNAAWKEIAHTLKRDVEDCKNKMISLLASYRRERSKVKKSLDSGKSNFLI